MRPEASFTKEQEAGWAGAGGPPGAQRPWSRLVIGTGSSCLRLLALGPARPVLPRRTESLNTRLEATPGFTPSRDGETEAWVEEDFPGWVIELVCWGCPGKEP